MSPNSESVQEKLRDALTLLYEARESAGIGTSLMISSVISELEGIINRHNNINEADANETPNNE